MLQNENVEILSRVQAQRKQMADLVAGLEGAFADLESAAQTLQEADADGLRDQNREADETMKVET